MNTMQRLLETLTVMVHGEITFAEEMLAEPARALATIGVESDETRRVICAVRSAGPEQIAMAPFVLPYREREETDAIGQALARARGKAPGRMHRAPRPSTVRPGAQAPRADDFQVLLVGDNPIKDCFEDLIGPPGSAGSEFWTMCPARAAPDRVAAASNPPGRAQLLPGVECFAGEHITTVRHGARLIRIAGDATRAVLAGLERGRPIGTTLAARTALARLASRGLAVAHYGEATATLHKWAVAGVSPRRASDVIEACDTAVIEVGAHAQALTELAREALAPYGLKVRERPDGAAHVLITASVLDVERIERIAKVVHEQGRQWSLLYAGPAGWLDTHGTADDGACACCVAHAMREGAMRHFARPCDDHAPPAHRPNIARIIGRATARWLAGAEPSGIVTCIAREPDVGTELEAARRRPQCPACGRTQIEHRARTGETLTREALEREAAHPANEREAFDRRMHGEALRGRDGAWTGTWTTSAEERFDADPHGHVLHDFARLAGLVAGEHRGDWIITRGKGPTRRSAWLGATAEMFQSLAVEWRATDAARVRTASQASLEAQGEALVGPDALNPVSDTQVDERAVVGYDRTGYPVRSPPRYGAREKHQPIEWVRGRDLETDATVWVPANAVFVGARADIVADGREESFHRTRLHNGVASGATRADALARAVLERIEHDALSWWWLLERTCPRIGLARAGGDWAARLESTLARGGRGLWALDISTTAKARAVLAVSALATPVAGVGYEVLTASAAALTPKNALLGALGELVQKLPDTIDGEVLSRYAAEGPHLEWWRAIDPEACAMFAGAGEQAPGPSEAVEPEGPERLRLAVAAARDAGAERIVGVDLTRPEQPVATARALTPGLRDSYAQRAPGRYDRRWPWLRSDERPRDEQRLSMRIAVL